MPISQHTPGPWIAADHYSTQCNDGQVRYSIPVRCAYPENPRVAAGNAIATVGLGDPGALSTDLEVVRSNARLIAAAPDLHDALCDLLEWAKGNRGPKNVNPYCVHAVKKALWALGKTQDVESFLDVETKR